jgi:hypothetical protein
MIRHKNNGLAAMDMSIVSLMVVLVLGLTVVGYLLEE